MKNARRFTHSPFSGSRWAAEASALIAALLLIGCQQHRLPGHVVGNGGGLLQQRFEAGRENARDVVLRLSDERLSQIGITPQADDHWLVDNRVKVAKEIAKMPWSDPEKPITTCPQHGPKWCLCTLPTLGAPVTISESGCAANPSVEEAGGLMLHEALHHFFGDDEARVYRLSSLVYTRWAYLAAFRAPVAISAPEEAESNGISSWNGAELLTWNPRVEAQIFRFRPGGGWSSLPLTPKPDWLESGRYGALTSRAALVPAGTDHLYVVGDTTGEMTEKPHSQLRDVSVDLTSGHWESFGRAEMDRWTGVVESGSRSGLGKIGGIIKSLTKMAPIISPESYALFPGLVASFLWPADGGLRFYYPHAAPDSLQWKIVTVADVLSWPRPIIVGSPHGLLIYNAQKGDGSVPNAGGGLWLDSQRGTLSKIAPGGPVPYRGRLLSAVDGDSIHVIGQQWMAWSMRRQVWETVQADVGSLCDWATQVYMTNNGALFWDDRTRRGVLWAR